MRQFLLQLIDRLYIEFEGVIITPGILSLTEAMLDAIESFRILTTHFGTYIISSSLIFSLNLLTAKIKIVDRSDSTRN